MSFNEQGPSPQAEQDISPLALKNLSSRLSDIVMQPRSAETLGSLAEVRLEKGAIVVGMYSFAGYIDDADKTIYSFTPESRADTGHFERAYRQLVDQGGYKLVHIIPAKPEWDDRNKPEPFFVQRFLRERGLVPRIQAVLDGEIQPVSGIVCKVLSQAEGEKQPLSDEMNEASSVVRPVVLTVTNEIKGTSSEMRVQDGQRLAL